MVFEELVAEHVVVPFPLLAAAIHHGLNFVVMAVEVGELGVVVELAVLFEILRAVTNGGLCTLAPHLEAEHSCTGKGEVSGITGWAVLVGVTEAAVGVLQADDVGNTAVCAALKVAEVEAGVFAGFQGLHVPCGDGEVAATVAVFSVRVIPTTGFVLVVDDELAGLLGDFHQVGDVDFELFAEGCGFCDRVGGDGVLVGPVLVCGIGGEFAVVFEADVDQVGHGLEDGITVFFGQGSFAMAEVGEEGETGHCGLVLVSPRAVGVLGGFEPVEGFDHRIFAFFGAAGFEEPGHAVFGRAAFAHFGRDVGEAATAAAVAAGAPAVTEVVAVTKVSGRFGDIHFRNGNGGWGCGVGCDDFGHRGGGRGGFALNLVVHFLFLDLVVLGQAGLIGDDRGGFLDEVGQQDEAKDQSDQHDDEKGDDQ